MGKGQEGQRREKALPLHAPLLVIETMAIGVFGDGRDTESSHFTTVQQ